MMKKMKKLWCAQKLHGEEEFIGAGACGFLIKKITKHTLINVIINKLREEEKAVYI